jgi:hypothetical protein
MWKLTLCYLGYGIEIYYLVSNFKNHNYKYFILALGT